MSLEKVGISSRSGNVGAQVLIQRVLSPGSGYGIVSTCTHPLPTFTFLQISSILTLQCVIVFRSDFENAAHVRNAIRHATGRNVECVTRIDYE